MAKSSLVGNLIIRLGADSTALDSSLQKTQKRVGKFAKSTRKRLNRAGQAFTGFSKTGSLALAGITTAAVAMNYQIGRTQAQLENFAQANGTTVSEVEKLQFALQKVGSETNARDVIRDLNDRVGDLRITGGGPLVDIIDRIGISAEQLATMNPTQQLDAIGKAIENMPTASQVTILEAISGEASELLPLLDNGAQKLNEFGVQAEQLGAVTSGTLRAGLIESYQSMFDLQTSLGSAGKIISAKLSPYIAQLSDDITDATSDSDEFGNRFGVVFEKSILYASKLANVVNGLVAVFQGIRLAGTGALGYLIIGFEKLIKKGFEGAAAVTEVIKSLAEGYNSIPGLPDVSTDGIQNQLRYYRQQIQETAQDTKKWYRWIDQAGEAFNNAVMRQTPGSAVEDWLERVKKRSEETAKSVENAANGNGGNNNNPNLENWTNVPDAGSGSKSKGPGQFDVTMDVPDRPEIMSQGQKDKDRIGDLQGTLSQYDSMAEKINKINDSYRSNIQLINRAAERRQITGDQQTRLLDKLAEKRNEDLEQARSNADQMSQFSIQASRNIQDQLGNTIESTLSGSFDGILKSWMDMLTKMATQAASSKILSGLFGKGQGSGGGLLGSLGGFGGIAGSVGGFVSGFLADGGPAKAGRSYVVGEEGPEIFSPSRSGTVIPNHDLGSGGAPSVGGSNVNVSIINQGGGDLQVTGRERKRNSDGSEEVKIMVRQAMSQMAATGEIENALGPYQLQRKQTTS